MGNPDIKDIFEYEDAIILAAMSYQTYPYYKENKIVLPKGFKLRYTVRAIAGVEQPTEEVFGFIAESKDKIILAFRGTVSSQDNDSNLDLFQMPYPFMEYEGKTHRGITRIYQSTRNKLIEKLNKFSVTKKLFVTGHSLGADLAILSSLDIAVNTQFKNPILYTFAASRVGDPNFVSHFNKDVKSSIRIYNVHDIVPTLPAREYLPPFTEEGLVYKHINTAYPLSFQLNNTHLNHKIMNYFNNLSKRKPDFTNALCNTNPGFCPAIDNYNGL